MIVDDLLQERSAKDLLTTYNDVAPLLKNIEDANRQARKTLNQLENDKLIFSNKEVRNQKKYQLVLGYKLVLFLSWFSGNFHAPN